MEYSDKIDTSEDDSSCLDICSTHDFNRLSMGSRSQCSGIWPCTQPELFDDHIQMKRKKLIKDVVRRHALPFLPAKSLIKFTSVSKEWDKWISSPLLAHQQSFSFKKTSGYFYKSGIGVKFFSLDSSAYGVPRPVLEFLPKDKRVLSSCNGLLLCWCSESYYVCNPATGDWKMLPNPGYYHGPNPAAVLAFEPSLQNIEAYYQVICAFPILGSHFVSFEIYSSATRTWRCSSAICTELGNSSISSLYGDGLYLKGFAYWETSSPGQVLAFNLHSEECGVVSLPCNAPRNGTFTQVGGELCYVTAQNHCKNVFIIDIHGGLGMNLKRSISINLEFSGSFLDECRVLRGIDGDFLLILSVTEDMQTVLHRYNLSDQKVEVVMNLREVRSDSRLLPYINSLAIVT